VNMNIQRPDGMELRLAREPSRTLETSELSSNRWRVATVVTFAVALLGASYFLLNASVTWLLIVGAALLLTIGFLVAFGFWVQNNTPVL
jgi:hypothetical protein